MENGNHHDHEDLKSGQTSPTDYPSIFTGAIRRSPSQETLVSSTTEVSDSTSNPSIIYPGAPVNSPQTQSLVGDVQHMNLENVDLKLDRVQSGPTPPESEADHDEAGHVHENSTWVKLAVEDVERGLERLATAAKDEHKIDPTKTVEEYYSETLAEIIKGAEIKLDPKHLQ